MAGEVRQQLPFRQVVIVGAGLAGLDIGCELKRKLNFHDFVIYDSNSGLGGTWFDNDYPGCAVDIPGFIYQLSFAPEHAFTRVFPSRKEMLTYMTRVATEHKIHRHIQPNVRWVNSTWLDDQKIWSIELRNAKTSEVSVQSCKVLIGAIGHQVDPKPFDVPGTENFRGRIVHACKWPENLDLKGKNVVVLGNGSTAVQVVPNILQKVNHCTQIQRAPQWILNRPNPRIPQKLINILAMFPVLFLCLQSITFAIVETFWPVLGRRIPSMAKKNMKSCGVPEKYHPILTPSYTPGCKRIIFAPEYLQCLRNPKVELVQDEIVALNAGNVVTASGKQYPCDVLILCHGFKAETFYYPLKGRRGITPTEHWDIAGGPSCYKGCAMNGFPNFFAIRGPNVSSGHQSLIYFIESTTALILKVAGPLIRGEVDVVEVESEAEKNYVNRVQAACKRGFWGRDCHTFYVTKDGWNHTVYPWTPYWLYFHKFPIKSHWLIEPFELKS